MHKKYEVVMSCLDEVGWEDANTTVEPTFPPAVLDLAQEVYHLVHLHTVHT
jgi:hypothetical protein